MPVVKPRYQYIDLGTCAIGRSADVKLPSHHSTPLQNVWVSTSEVLRFINQTFSGPVFETVNSIYEPAPQDSDKQNHLELAKLEARSPSLVKSA